MQKLRCNEYQLQNVDVQRVMGDLIEGQLSVFHKDGSHVDFQLVDKAFDDEQLLAFFFVLDANDIPVEENG